eukprot:TRINITY_DN8046_c0_g1_i1.p1 TRINITY_DN8046_c0_g1~~TRINITY_DN8046_c0_g1_i1.p1  ORF type:complete len:441 (+),score=46.63 TRINITY_DN8046_c0_g1_i1:48-1325(+)
MECEKLFLFMILCANSCLCLRILSPIDEEMFTPTSYVYTPTFSPFEAELFFLDTEPDVGDVGRKIVVKKGSMFSGANIEDKVKRNPSAVMFTDIDDYPGNECILRYKGYTDRGVPIGIFHISDYNKLLNISNNHTVPIRVLFERNESLWAHREIYLAQILICGTSFIVILICIYKLYYHVKFRKGFTITLAIMFSEIIGNLIRFVVSSIDPFYTKGVIYARTQLYLVSINWPFTLFSILLIFLYWTEIQSKKVRATSFIVKYRVQYMIFCTFLVSADIFISLYESIASSAYVLYILAFARSLSYGVLMSILMIAFLIRGGQLLSILRAMKERNRSRIKSTQLILASCSGILLFWTGTVMLVIAYFITLSGYPKSEYPIAGVIRYGLTYIGCNVCGVCIILAISTKEIPLSSSGSGGSVKKTISNN